MTNLRDNRADWEEEAIDEFLTKHFPPGYGDDQGTLAGYADDDGVISDEEMEEIETLVNRAESLFSSSKGTLGLAIDFIILAEELSHTDDWLLGYDSEISRSDILERYESTAKSSLTLKRDNTKEGIRSFHNELIDLFRNDLSRTNFPSSPGHHTGEWERYDDMLENAFRLSRDGRYEAAQRLFDIGLERLESKDYQRRDPPFTKPFVEVLRNYERSAPFEQGGSAYQALCYGYVKAQWPHLSLRASKVRTGSSRQHRYGDIDGYYGPDLMISVEVKDLVIDGTNVDSQLGTMMDVAQNTTSIAIAICRRVTDDARETLEEAGVRVLDDEDLDERLATWDYHKQNRAVQGMIHFLTNIEENPEATQRLLEFIAEVDSENRSVIHLSEK
ncbi:hypothetical protein GJ631_14930 [Natronomonas sp. CBA1123]|uniref:hypothetical protein n=1 Tax=Natronomonas sp. CBA1123 TaxID=2668070 RepID=UPI0013090054|nr:hypothetical protein [Natronomonas sp. CBA1123]MUV87810.1 hypothetical protein [Natronomonas sp. CBA1123]